MTNKELQDFLKRYPPEAELWESRPSFVIGFPDARFEPFRATHIFVSTEKPHTQKEGGDWVGRSRSPMNITHNDNDVNYIVFD